MSLESLKSAFNKIEQNQPESTDLSKGSHSFGTNGSVHDIIKIDGIGTEQSPSPLTAIYGDNGAVVNGNSENVIQINDFRNGVYNLDVGVVKGNSDIVKNESTLTIRAPLGQKRYRLESIFDPTHGPSLPTPLNPTSPLESDLNLFAKNPHDRVSTKNLNIRAHSTINRNGFGGKLKEPYIVKKIGNKSTGLTIGFNRDVYPIQGLLDDEQRFKAFYSSLSGIASLARENVTNFFVGDNEIPINPLASTMAPPIPTVNTGFLNMSQQFKQSLGGRFGSIRKPLKIETSKKATLGLPFKQLGDRTIGLANAFDVIFIDPNLKEENPLLHKSLTKLKQATTKALEASKDAPPEFSEVPLIGKPTPFIDLSGKSSRFNAVTGKIQSTNTKYNDKVSGMPDIDIQVDDDIAPNKKGDFYVRFKDLRDGTFIYFRGFVTGITENVTPTFNPVSYVGRSEDVYVYQKGERDISFNLKIYPANGIEHGINYMKLERLTSLAYPSYFKDQADGFRRMKPPFTELYMAHIGTRKKGYFGFIKSISYTVPETGDWDALTLTPRLFEVAVSYQILHRKPPQLGTKFYKSHGEMA